MYMSEAVGYTNPDVQTSIAEAVTEMDTDACSALVMDMQVLFAADVPVIVVHHSILITTYRTDKFAGWIAFTGDYKGGGIAYGRTTISFGAAPLNTLNLTSI